MKIKQLRHTVNPVTNNPEYLRFIKNGDNEELIHTVYDKVQDRMKLEHFTTIKMKNVKEKYFIIEDSTYNDFRMKSLVRGEIIAKRASGALLLNIKEILFNKSYFAMEGDIYKLENIYQGDGEVVEEWATSLTRLFELANAIVSYDDTTDADYKIIKEIDSLKDINKDLIVNEFCKGFFELGNIKENIEVFEKLAGSDVRFFYKEEFLDSIV